MTEWHRSLLALLAAFIHAIRIGFKFAETGKQGPADPKTRWRSIRFSVIRLFLDGAILIGFLLSDLCPAWFRFFRETTMGYCTGFMELITITLIVSAFIDWIPLRQSYLEADHRPHPFARFLLRQFVRITQILFAMSLVWIVFLFLEPTQTSIWLRIAASVLVLVWLRIMLRVARRSGNDAQTDENQKAE